MTLLTDEEQPVPRTVLPARVTTARAALASVIGIDADAATACQGGFVADEASQFRKGPAGGMPIRLVCFGGNGNQLVPFTAPLTTSGSLSDARQVFQTYQTVGIGVQDVLGNRVVRAHR